MFLSLEVLSQCPLALLVEVRLREVKTLGRETGKWLQCGFCYERRREVEPGLYRV